MQEAYGSAGETAFTDLPANTSNKCERDGYASQIQLAGARTALAWSNLANLVGGTWSPLGMPATGMSRLLLSLFLTAM